MNITFNEYKTLVEQAPIMIWRANLSTECDYFNETWLKFTGKTMEQEVGNAWANGVHPDDMDHCLKIYLGSFKKREIFEMKYRLRRHDGEYRWLFDRGVPFVDEKGVFAGYIGSCIDITEQVMADDYLRRARERELEQLRGLLPICSYCKKIRDSQGQWQVLESYIEKHTKADFTHGLCQDCRKVHFSDT